MEVIVLTLGMLGTNCYILYETENRQCAVIDPADKADTIINTIEENKLVLRKILLTHAHFDHIMAVEALRTHYKGVEVCVHYDDAEMLTDPEHNCMNDFCYKPIAVKPPDCRLRNGSEIMLGNEKITVMHTPGHTKGSVCYITDEYIFSGDTLFAGSVGRCDLYGGSYDTLLESLNRLKALDKDYKIYPGHGDQSTLFHEKTNNIYMKTLR